MQKQTNKILVHACCGVCFAYPLFLLREEGYEPFIYYFNSNIFPENEFERRFLELEKYCIRNDVEYFKADYNHREYLKLVEGLEQEPEKGKRCLKCFEYRLRASVQFAKDNGFDAFTTTLTVSPHKVSKDIFLIAENLSKEFEIKFLNYDFKKHDGFKKTSKLAYDFGMYRQNYCGCEFSIRK